MACGILLPRPGIKPASTALEAWSLNCWTAREVPYYFLCSLFHYTKLQFTLHYTKLQFSGSVLRMTTTPYDFFCGCCWHFISVRISIIIIKKPLWNTYIIMHSIVPFKIFTCKMLCWYSVQTLLSRGLTF